MPLTQKAYKNLTFLNSPAARHIRLLCEYEEPRARFNAHNVRDTIVVFGSARVSPPSIAEDRLVDAEAQLAVEPKDSPRYVTMEHNVVAARRAARLAPYYEAARELSKRLTEWSMARKKGKRYLIATGGGPGIMEAGNRGAADVPNGESVGLGISLPFEEKVNEFVPEHLAFEFHYFFLRKYWFAYLAKAMVIMPGGFGTFDELFEILTLRQTGRIKKPLPMVLFGRAYWDEVVNLEAMVEWGTISERDLLLVHRTDSVDDAFQFLTRTLETVEREESR